MKYSEKVMDHFQNPHNVGTIKNADGKAMVGDPNCGDFIQVWINVKDHVINDYKYKVFGCGAAIATTSVVSDMSIGKTINQALQLTDDDVVNYLGGLPEGKRHCSLLGIQGLHVAIADYLVQNYHVKFQRRIDFYKKKDFDISAFNRMLAEHVNDVPENAKILDVGADDGNLAVAMALAGKKCTSLYRSAKAQHNALLNATYYHVDELIDFQLDEHAEFPFDKKTFDVVLSMTALHHYKDTETVLLQIQRVCSKNGKIILADFTKEGQQIIDPLYEVEGEDHVLEGWELDCIIKWFQDRGLHVTSVVKEPLWIIEIENS